jgi:TPP-dependent pyruvate/acetoin dehydrogenase alpha subunit
MENQKEYKKIELLTFYREMLRIRKMEEKIYELYTHSKMYGMSPHLYIGEEAVAVGVCKNLKKEDYIVSTHRGHGHCLAKGGEIKKILAEILGKDTGYCHGLGGSMHIANIDFGNLGANGIVGAGLPISLGAGLSIKYKNTDQVCVCFFGDAASNQGTFHESLNFASAFKFPIVFVCENNMYGLSTKYTHVSATTDVADRAKGYDIPGIIVDGMNVLRVYEESEKLIARARSGKGPSLLECKTYRFMGHGASDHRPYRTKTEEREWIKKCPLEFLKKHMLKKNNIKEKEIIDIEKNIEIEIDEAVNYAFNSPDPDISKIKDSVFYERNNI